MRAAARDDFKFRERRIARKIRVRINLDIGGMIDGQQAHAIEIIQFFHRLDHAKKNVPGFQLDL